MTIQRELYCHPEGESKGVSPWAQSEGETENRALGTKLT